MKNPNENIRKIQHDYFKLLKSHFVEEQKEISGREHKIREYVHSKAKGRTSGIVVPSLTNGFVSSLEYKFDQLVKEVNQFWEENYVSLHQSIQELDAFTLLMQFSGPKLFLPEDNIRKFGDMTPIFDTSSGANFR